MTPLITNEGLSIYNYSDTTGSFSVTNKYVNEDIIKFTNDKFKSPVFRLENIDYKLTGQDNSGVTLIKTQKLGINFTKIKEDRYNRNIKFYDKNRLIIGFGDHKTSKYNLKTYWENVRINYNINNDLKFGPMNNKYKQDNSIRFSNSGLTLINGITWYGSLHDMTDVQG